MDKVGNGDCPKTDKLRNGITVYIFHVFVFYIKPAYKLWPLIRCNLNFACIYKYGDVYL